MTVLRHRLLPCLFLFGSSSLAEARLSSSVGQARSLQTFDCDGLNCDDGNSLTIDTCSADVGCQHTCDDGNACTLEAFVDGTCQYVDENNNPYDCSNEDGSNCIPGLINCSDDNPFTTDVCVPSSGCRHFGFFEYVGNLVGLDSALAELETEEIIFYEEQSTLSDDQVADVLDWIKLEVTQLRTPFCWRRSYGRGVGEPIAHCPPGKERIGLFCYTPCPAGFSRQGTLDCHQNCKEGWRDDGLFCRLPEYGRGAGYPWRFGDPLNDSKMFQRCEADHGGGNCEKWGWVVYPKCRPGYSPFGCCICRPSFESCEAEGYTNIRIDLSCAAKIELGDPTPLQCRDGLEQDGLLCYPPCQAGFNGLGPVCWQQCDSDQTWCAAGCASDLGACIFAATDQLITPIIAAANIATLGVSAAPTNAAGTVLEIANQLYEFATLAGEVMGWLATVLEVTNINEAPTNAQVVAFTPNTGNIVLDSAVSATLFGAQVIMGRQFAQDFVSLTSPEIAQTLHAYLDPRDVLLVTRTWADVQFWEMASTEGWNLANLLLSSFGPLDPTGITNLLAAYVKPVCLEIIPFPVCTSGTCPQSFMAFRLPAPYEVACEDVQVFASPDANCEAVVEPISVDGSSLHPDHEKIFLQLEPAGPFPVQDSPQRVTLTATSDEDGKSSSCTASITVTDDTPSSIACSVGRSQNNDPGLCGATVDYSDPVLTQNCYSSSTVHQTAGLSSGSMFEVGTTTNSFQVVDSSGKVDGECSFAIGVFDTEPPRIDCSGLAAKVSTDQGACMASYAYHAPVAQDNCQASTVLTQSPGLDPHSFPLGDSTVEYTATDVEGNSASCSFVVHVSDGEAPVASCLPVRGSRGVFTIGGKDNCSDESDLKAYVIDSVSGVQFPTAKSGVEYYKLGTAFEFQQVGKGAPSQDKPGTPGQGAAQWRLFGPGQPNVIVEDAAGNKSEWAICDGTV